MQQNRRFSSSSSTNNSQDAWTKVKWNGWGEQGKYFDLNENGSVQLYPTGNELPKLAKFIKEVVQIEPSEEFETTPSVEPTDIVLPTPQINEGFLKEISSVLNPNQINKEDFARICHTYGRSHRDLWRLRRGIISQAPDLVLLPQSHEDVAKIVAAAHTHNVVIIPYGGGTNIVGAVEADDPLGTPPSSSSSTFTRRTIASLDMRRMNRLLWLDRRSNQACFEAGVLGPDLESQLNREGYSLGHDPDSFQFSTLGGWIATCSSGMQSDKYGDIEDLTVSLKIATPAFGTVTTPAVPRNGGALDMKRMWLGSEGVLGVITQAVMKVHKVPQVKEFHGVLVRDWETGVKMVENIVKGESHAAMIRLYDPDETKLSFSMKPKSKFIAEQISIGIKKWLEFGKGFDMDQICLMILGFEGERQNVAHQKKIAFKFVKQLDGFWIGQGPGRSWYDKRYDLPLLRDFLLSNGMWVDVAESSMSWTDIIKLWREAKEAIKSGITGLGYPAWAGAHISHTYNNGVCVYFHYASVLGNNGGTDEEDLKVYLAAKKGATDAILKNGGALTHHHGVGFEHVPWVNKYFGKSGVGVMKGLKDVVDPNGVCNPGKLFSMKREGEDGKKEEKDEDYLYYTRGLVENRDNAEDSSTLTKSRL